MRKYTKLILAMILAIILLAGCASSPSGSSSILGSTSSYVQSISSSSSVVGIDLGDNADYFWETDLLGWAITPGNPDIYETVDGGNIWTISEVAIPSDMYYNPIEFRGAWINQEDDGWHLTLGGRRVEMPGGGFLFGVNYDFVLNDNSRTWVWNEPNWMLPDGLNKIEFIDYVQFYLFPPVEYNSVEGLQDIDAVLWLVFNTADFEKRVGRSLVNQTVPYATIDTMASYFYGDKLFSSASFKSDLEYWLKSNDEGYIYDGHWPRGELESLTIQDVSILENGQIEAIIFHDYFEGAGVGWVDGIVPDPLYQCCVFEPVVVESVRFFTLLSSEIISTP